MGEGDKRVVRNASGEREAPILAVLYRCNKCGIHGIMDAYQGPPSCNCEGANFMHPLRIVDEYSEIPVMFRAPDQEAEVSQGAK